MGSEHLRKLVAQMKPLELQNWHARQVLLAASIRRCLALRLGKKDTSNSVSSDLPDALAIVAETIVRIYDGYSDSYEWDGVETFDLFLVHCFKITCTSLREAERRHADGKAIVFCKHPDLSMTGDVSRQDDVLAQKQDARALASAVEETKMAGGVRKYVANLPKYAAEGWAVREIADDIGVKRSTIPSYRKRLLENKRLKRALKLQESK